MYHDLTVPLPTPRCAPTCCAPTAVVPQHGTGLAWQAPTLTHLTSPAGRQGRRNTESRGTTLEHTMTQAPTLVASVGIGHSHVLHSMLPI